MSGYGSRSRSAWAGEQWRNFRMKCRSVNLSAGVISMSAFHLIQCTSTTGPQR